MGAIRQAGEEGREEIREILLVKARGEDLMEVEEEEEEEEEEDRKMIIYRQV